MTSDPIPELCLLDRFLWPNGRMEPDPWLRLFQIADTILLHETGVNFEHPPMCNCKQSQRSESRGGPTNINPSQAATAWICDGEEGEPRVFLRGWWPSGLGAWKKRGGGWGCGRSRPTGGGDWGISGTGEGFTKEKVWWQRLNWDSLAFFFLFLFFPFYFF